MPERQEMLKSMKIDIVDELEAEASYRYFDLFQRAADEIKMLRKSLGDIAAVTFCPKCHSQKKLNEDPSGQRRDGRSGGWRGHE